MFATNMTEKEPSGDSYSSIRKSKQPNKKNKQQLQTGSYLKKKKWPADI